MMGLRQDSIICLIIVAEEREVTRIDTLRFALSSHCLRLVALLPHFRRFAPLHSLSVLLTF